ncbi:MAG: septum formation initiator family protein [Patescibacteria group bacterium]|jgi:cell division protein FtsB|nr:septum formation initiator family protein [Patescibacteria group bacterium]
MNKNRDLKNMPIRESNDNNLFTRLFSNQKIVALLILAVIILLLFPLAKSYSQRKIIEKEISQLQEEIDKYEQDNEELKEFLSYIDSNQAVEKQARTSLNLKKTGEGVIVIEEPGYEEEKEMVEKLRQSQEGNFKKWLRYFFG